MNTFQLLIFSILIFLIAGCSNTSKSKFDLEYEKTLKTLDPKVKELMNRYLDQEAPLKYSICLFKQIDNNCNFEEEGLLPIGFGSAYELNDSIQATFALPFGNYNFNFKRFNDLIQLSFKEFHDEADNVVKLEKDEIFGNEIEIPLDDEIILFENHRIEDEVFEVWGKLRTMNYFKLNQFNENEISEDCFWEVEFLVKLNINKAS